MSLSEMEAMAQVGTESLQGSGLLWVLGCDRWDGKVTASLL